MNYYEQNIECLRKYKKNMYETFEVYINSFENVSPKEECDIEVYSVDTRDNISSLVIKRDKKEYRMNSIIHPLAEAERWVEQYKFYCFNNVIVLFGLGNGLIAQTIVKRMGESTRLIIYEPSVEVFIHVLHQYDLQYLLSHNRVEIAIDNINKHAFHFSLNANINVTNIKTKIMCMHPCYEKVFPKQGIFFWKELKDIDYYAMVNIRTEIVFGEQFIENILNNLIYLKNSNTIYELSEVLSQDNPVIIVSAGPSVVDNIEALKKAKNRAIIIAVDRVFDFLIQNGIEPDFIATVDPVKPTEFFTNKENVTIPLICILEAQWKILNIHKGRKILTRVNPFMKEIYTMNGKEAPKAATGSGVSTMAFCACITMGFKTIILVGQDLAYRGKTTHAGGVIENESTIDREVEGMDGEKVLSRDDWYRFIVWYEDIIKCNNEIKVYDTKKSGAKIKGTIVKSLDEIMEDYSTNKIDCKEIMDNLSVTFNKEELMKIKNYFEEFYETLDNIKIKALDACHVCDLFLTRSAERKMSSEETSMYMDILGEITEYINQCDIYYLLESYISTNAMKQLSNIYSFTGNQEEDEKDTYRKAKHVFATIVDGCDYLRPLLEKGTGNILK